MRAILTPHQPQAVCEHRPFRRTKLGVMAADLVAAGAGLTIAHGLMAAGPDGAVATVTLLAVWALWLGQARLYSIRFITRRSDEIRRVVDAGLRALGTVALTGFELRWEVGRLWVVLAVGFGTVGLLVERELVRRIFNARRRSGSMRRSAIVVGDNDEGRDLEAMFTDDDTLGYEIAAVVATSHEPSRPTLVKEVFDTLDRTGAANVVLAATAIPPDHSNRLVRDLLEAGVHVELSSTLADIEPHRLTVRPLGRYPVVYVEPVSRTGWRPAAKRTFDVVVAALALVLTAPLWAVLAVSIRLDSPGPVLFRQLRIGRDGVLFPVLKFRTMVQDAEQRKADLEGLSQGPGPLFKMKVDPRVTRVGRRLRKLSLDELPQLWNVLRGEMSLVGPRPALPSETDAWDDDLYGRLRVRPGITGIWQVSGRSGTTFAEYTRLDLYYVDNWSLVVDLSILLRTVPAVLKSDGAY